MRVYLIRHTAPEVGKDVCYGQADIGLAESFELDKQNVIAKLKPSFGSGHVYTSPLTRCTRLAEALTQRGAVIDDRLLELNFGDWERTPWNDIDRLDLDEWLRDFVSNKPPRGESLQMLYDRTVNFIAHLLAQSHDTAAIVTHAGVIRCFWAYIVEIPLKNSFRIGVEYGDVFELELTGDAEYATIKKM